VSYIVYIVVENGTAWYRTRENNHANAIKE
jgi:hypothetical protein